MYLPSIFTMNLISNEENLVLRMTWYPLERSAFMGILLWEIQETSCCICKPQVINYCKCI